MASRERGHIADLEEKTQENMCPRSWKPAPSTEENSEKSGQKTR